MGRLVLHKAFFLAFLVICGCSLSSNDDGISVFTVESDLADNKDGWEIDFTGYPNSYEDSVEYQLAASWTNLPTNIGGKGLKITGNNLDGNLFMFMKTEVTGLAPNTVYAIMFSIRLASNAQFENDGSNGSPGQNVFLKAGASTIEPKKIKRGSYCEFNLDKGNSYSGAGTDVIALDNIAVTSTNGEYMLMNKTNVSSSIVVRTNSSGSFWIVVGTDSAYKGVTTVYYKSISVTMTAPN